MSQKPINTYSLLPAFVPGIVEGLSAVCDVNGRSVCRRLSYLESQVENGGDDPEFNDAPSPAHGGSRRRGNITCVSEGVGDADEPGLGRMDGSLNMWITVLQQMKVGKEEPLFFVRAENALLGV
jgi:hypothetical protein